MTLLELATSQLGEELVDLDPQQLAVLTQIAAAAVESGAAPSLEDLAGWSRLERVAWIQGRRIVATQEARRLALALRGESGYLAAGADTEGLEAYDAAMIRELGEQIAQRSA